MVFPAVTSSLAGEASAPFQSLVGVYGFSRTNDQDLPYTHKSFNP